MIADSAADLGWAPAVLIVARRWPAPRGARARRPNRASARVAATAALGVLLLAPAVLGGADARPRDELDVPGRRPGVGAGMAAAAARAAAGGRGGGSAAARGAARRRRRRRRGAAGGGATHGGRPRAAGGGGMFGGDTTALTAALAYAKANGGGTVAVSSQSGARRRRSSSRAPTSPAIGGFSGRESVVTTAWLADAVDDGPDPLGPRLDERRRHGQDGRTGATDAMASRPRSARRSSSVDGLYDLQGTAAAIRAAAA